MGKLRLENEDITNLAEIFKKEIKASDDALIVDLGGSTLSLTNLTTSGFFEQNGVRFQINARFSSGALDVDFD